MTGSNQDRADSEDRLRLLLRDGSGRWAQGGAEASDSVRERLSPRKTTGATRAAQGQGKGCLKRRNSPTVGQVETDSKDRVSGSGRDIPEENTL